MAARTSGAPANFRPRAGTCSGGAPWTASHYRGRLGDGGQDVWCIRELQASRPASCRWRPG
eukprot:9330467-Heterocapsa_arctica.AAC.1